MEKAMVDLVLGLRNRAAAGATSASQASGGSTSVARYKGLALALALACAGVTTLSTAPASADHRPFMRRLSLGAGVGYQAFSEDSGLGNGNQPDEVPQAGPSFGLRLSMPVLEQLGLDAEAMFTPTSLPSTPVRKDAAGNDFSATDEGSGMVIGVRLLARWDIVHLGDITPFFSAGFGQAILIADKFFTGTKVASVKSPDVDNTYLIGVGASYDIGYRGSARIDARWVGGDVRPGMSGMANGFEVLLGMSWALGGPAEDKDQDGVPDETDQCVDKAEDKDGFEDNDGCPELDNDDDGVIDAADKCQGELEDKDGFQDDDGCPDLDNDGDSINDKQDKCPDKSEDKDGFQDDDGCPELDNDGDGIADKQDKCADKAEDKDGFEDSDGCPDRDNDGDGFPDGKDKCPTEPETPNGVDDGDGCPDAMAAEYAPLFEGALKGLKWKGDALDKKSSKVLEKYVELMLTYDSVKISVEIHTAGKAADVEKELAEKRGATIRAHFVDSAIDGSRIVVIPTGADKPISQATGKKAWAENERVEIRIATPSAGK